MTLIVSYWWSLWGPLFHWDSVPSPVAPRGLSSFPYLLSQIPGPGRSSDDDFLARMRVVSDFELIFSYWWSRWDYYFPLCPPLWGM